MRSERMQKGPWKIFFTAAQAGGLHAEHSRHYFSSLSMFLQECFSINPKKRIPWFFPLYWLRIDVGCFAFVRMEALLGMTIEMVQETLNQIIINHNLVGPDEELGLHRMEEESVRILFCYWIIPCNFLSGHYRCDIFCLFFSLYFYMRNYYVS